MALQDPEQRKQTGIKKQAELTGAPAPEPATLLQSSWRDYIFAEVWTRPGLDLRSRYFISIAGAACEGGREDVIDSYIRGALTTKEITLSELREAALHLAAYAGWSKAMALDAAITRVQDQLSLAAAEFAPIRGEAWDPQERFEEGGKNFRDTMKMPSPPPVTPYFEGGILNFVFGEMWNRPGLDQRARRWITMVGVADSSARTPIRSHTYAAMASGNATLQEMQEFVLQYAIHSGWPKGSVMQMAVIEMGKLIEAGRPYED